MLEHAGVTMHRLDAVPDELRTLHGRIVAIL